SPDRRRRVKSIAFHPRRTLRQFLSQRKEDKCGAPVELGGVLNDSYLLGPGISMVAQVPLLHDLLVTLVLSVSLLELLLPMT
ncbi:MAG: hypothetical protein PVJ11_15320, partial [Syntrophobacterales bacterium]